MCSLNVTKGLGILPKTSELGQQLMAFKIHHHGGGFAAPGNDHAFAVSHIIEQSQPILARL